MALYRPKSSRDLLGYLLNSPMPTVNVASPLRSYTHGAASVACPGATIAEVLANLDQQYPGIRFRMIDEQNRIRQHIRIFVNSNGVNDQSAPVASYDIVHLICALSGG